MTFEYTDPTGERLYFRPAVVNAHQPTEAVALETETGRPVYFSADQLEDVIAGMRDIRRQAARTASGQQPETTPCSHCKGSGADPDDEGDYLPEVGRHNPFSGGPCPECNGEGTAAEPDPTTADDPIQLRWGLGDVLWGDDDTVTVCFSGPDREPYWLELDAERAAALRDDLAGPAVGQPAEAQATDEARPPATSWTACRRGDTDWLVASSNYDDRDQALERLAKRRKEQPDAEFALVRETTTWTVEDETR